MYIHVKSIKVRYWKPCSCSSDSDLSGL